MKARMAAICGALVLAVTFAYADDIRLKNSAEFPAATGKVDFGKDENGNTKAKVEVKHLAKPESLVPAKTHYVVWVQPTGKEAESVGALRVNDDLNGELEFVTTHREFDIFVTAEDSPRVTSPSGTEVMRGVRESD